MSDNHNAALAQLIRVVGDGVNDLRGLVVDLDLGDKVTTLDYDVRTFLDSLVVRLHDLSDDIEAPEPDAPVKPKTARTNQFGYKYSDSPYDDPRAGSEKQSPTVEKQIQDVLFRAAERFLDRKQDDETITDFLRRTAQVYGLNHD